MLTKTQQHARDCVIKKMQTGEYALKENPCLCGAKNDLSLANEDRYGIPVRTMLCLNCGLIRTNPYYDEKTLKNFYQNEYRTLYTGDEQATKEFFSNQQSFGAMIHDFLSDKIFNGQIKNKKVFEIGCGAGGILDTFRARDNEVFGCDYGEEYVKFGQAKGLNLVAGDSSKLSQFGKADIIILNHTLEHMTMLKLELEKIRELLSPSGVLYIALPGIYSIHETYQGRFVKRYIQNAHVWYFTLKTLSATLKRFGWNLIEGDEIIMSAFTTKIGNKPLEAEDPGKILAYLKKINKLQWYYSLKKFSLRQFALETLRHFGPLYVMTRSVYRKIKQYEK